MTRNGGGKKKSVNCKSNRVSVEIKDLKFEPSVASDPSNKDNSETAPKTTLESADINENTGSNKLEKILSELESGCLAECSKESKSDAVGYLKKKMATLGFQAGIQLSGGGAFRDARKLLDGFPGDDEYELTFEEVESSEELSDTEGDEDEDEEEEDSCDDEELLLSGLDRLDPLRVISSKIGEKVADGGNGNGLNYPLIDPLKLQVIQSAESELTTVHDLFESTSISANQKLPLLKRKYMELMQQDIRHRLEALRVRDYLDTLHLERQVVERELEKAVNLRSSMEQLCERLQAENSKIRAEKAGITSKIYSDLELKALEEDISNNNTGNTSSNSNSKKSNKKQQQKNTGSSSKSTSQMSSTKSSLSLPSSLPEAMKSISFEVPDANKLLEGAQGDLKARFQLLIDLYNQREVHFLSVLKAKDAEIQLLQSHFFSHQSQLQKLNQTNRELNAKICDLSSSESDLRAQLSVYVDKFKQVEDTLSKSNDLFATFRHEMEQMTQKLGRLEKENGALQNKCTTLSRNIIEMADERSKQAAAIELLKNQKGKLENLCRTMQAERNAALQTK
jgi:hypothetical protein